MQNDNSSVNTVLIVIVLLLIVAFGVWWFAVPHVSQTPAPAGASINVNLPTGSGADTANPPAPGN